MSDSLSLAIPCRADEPGLSATLASLYEACQPLLLPPRLIEELVICINGFTRGTSCASLLAARTFCAQHNIVLTEIWVGPDGKLPQRSTDKPAYATDWTSIADTTRSECSEKPPSQVIPVCTVMLTERRGKPPAWNILRHCAAGENVLFCDADVRVDPESVRLLYDRLQRAPQLSLVAAREVPVLEGRETLWGRMGALPYRFDFGNAGGRLLMMRKNALPGEMPEDLLLEDAWLTVALGKAYVAKEWQAKVYFLPPSTGRDYFAERVRTEGGKLQIRRAHGKLLEDGPIATYRWTHFFNAIAVREYPLVLLAMLVRMAASLWARLVLTFANQGFYALYRPFLTTKKWPETRR